MRLQPVMNVVFSIALGAVAVGCVTSDAEPEPEPMSTQVSAIGSSPCVYGTFDRVGNHIVGWAVDLCNGAPWGGAGMAVLTGGLTGHRDIYYGTCEYFEDVFIWCSGNVYVSVNIGGVTYSGMYGFDIDPYAGGQLPRFNATYILAGDQSQDVIPFIHYF